MFTDTAPSHYRDEMERANHAVEPYVFELDGSHFVGHDCPDGLAVYYAHLISAGYANGWLA